MKIKTNFRVFLPIVVGCCLLPANLYAQEPFYKGKTLEILIGLAPGGGYDAYGRLLTRFIGKHIPGNPTVVPRNMPGAGSLTLINHLYTVAPKTGLTIGTFDPAILIAPLIGGANANFDASKFSWIGSMAGGTSVCVTWETSPIKRWEDLFLVGEAMPFGTSGPADSRYQHTAILKNMFNANVKLVPGYDGSSGVRLALQRGEIAGNCGDSWASLKSTASDWIKEHKINVVAQFAVKKHNDLPDVPLITEKAENQIDRDALQLLLSSQEAGRPFAAPPGISEDLLGVLRRAFDATMRDPDLADAAAKMAIEIEAMNGDEVGKLWTQIYRTSPAAISTAKAAIR